MNKKILVLISGLSLLGANLVAVKPRFNEGLVRTLQRRHDDVVRQGGAGDGAPARPVGLAQPPRAVAVPVPVADAAPDVGTGVIAACKKLGGFMVNNPIRTGVVSMVGIAGMKFFFPSLFKLGDMVPYVVSGLIPLYRNSNTNLSELDLAEFINEFYAEIKAEIVKLNPNVGTFAAYTAIFLAARRFGFTNQAVFGLIVDFLTRSSNGNGTGAGDGAGAGDGDGAHGVGGGAE